MFNEFRKVDQMSFFTLCSSVQAPDGHRQVTAIKPFHVHLFFLAPQANPVWQ